MPATGFRQDKFPLHRAKWSSRFKILTTDSVVVIVTFRRRWLLKRGRGRTHRRKLSQARVASQAKSRLSQCERVSSFPPAPTCLCIHGAAGIPIFGVISRPQEDYFCSWTDGGGHFGSLEDDRLWPFFASMPDWGMLSLSWSASNCIVTVAQTVLIIFRC